MGVHCCSARHCAYKPSTNTIPLNVCYTNTSDISFEPGTSTDTSAPVMTTNIVRNFQNNDTIDSLYTEPCRPVVHQHTTYTVSVRNLRAHPHRPSYTFCA